MRRLLGAMLAVSLLAFVACIGTALAQPTPRPPVMLEVARDEAHLEWAPATEFAAPGGSLADPSGLSYDVEALAPGASEWAVIATTTATSYTATGLRPGTWRFRVRGRILKGPPGEPSPEATKTIGP